MNFLRILVASAVLAAPSAASAQQVKLQLQHGHVSLDVRSVPVGQILAEWARVGSVKIVNGEKVQGPPVTLQLTDVPERQALDLLLRGVAAYMLGVRAPGAAGASAYDRILILATSSVPRNPAPAPVTAQQVPRAIQADTPSDAFPDPVTGPGGAVRRFAPPVIRPPAIPPAAPPEAQDGATPPPTPVAVTPANPFGLPMGSGLPGTITPPTSPQAPAGR